MKVFIDAIEVEFSGGETILELCNKVGIDLPTFCYHPDISVFGACRMCIVEVDNGKWSGILPACSSKAADGMVVRTNTAQIRKMRKMIVELMLASHDQQCTTCPKSENCRLQSVAKSLGITHVRFQSMPCTLPRDYTSPSIARDPSKCVLCGNCVRVCNEIQSVGALDFSYRGAKSVVGPGYNKGLGETDCGCVNCGQCVKICPVGALTPKHHIDEVWAAIHDKNKKVVVQVAPAVRVALAEYFGKEAGTVATGAMVTALKRMGFDKVFDTCYGADLTIKEEGDEFLERQKGDNPGTMYTSCCSAWVAFAERNYPELLPSLSTCRSPQQMLGAVIKDQIPAELGVSRDDLVVVSVMPCTAKKPEAAREELGVDGSLDVDIVITTHELSLMLKEIGVSADNFDKLEPDLFDAPFAMTSGSAVIFGAAGGVSEAVLRYIAESQIRGGATSVEKLGDAQDGVKVSEIDVGGKKVKLAAVSGLANTRKLIERIKNGEAQYDLVEVMACSGGCVNGGGQPIVALGREKVKNAERVAGLYESDEATLMPSICDNDELTALYESAGLDHDKAHSLLHTTYTNRQVTLEQLKNKYAE
jgi:NADH-quinone oxidoreductase subunit G